MLLVALADDRMKPIAGLARFYTVGPPRGGGVRPLYKAERESRDLHSIDGKRREQSDRLS